MSDPRKWTIIESEHIVNHPIVRVRRDTAKMPDGTQINDYYVVEENDFALIFALTPEREVVIVEQYKHALGDVCLEIPGGYFDGDAPDPVAEARRELREETGFDTEEWHFISKTVTHPTRIHNHMYVYAALNAKQLHTQDLDEAEDITVKRIPIDELFAMMRDGHFNVALSIAAIYQSWDYLKMQGLV